MEFKIGALVRTIIGVGENRRPAIGKIVGQREVLSDSNAVPMNTADVKIITPPLKGSDGQPVVVQRTQYTAKPLSH